MIKQLWFLVVDACIYVYIVFNKLQQSLLDLAKTCYTLLELAIALLKLCRNLLELATTLFKLTATLPKLAVTCYKLIKLAEFSRIHLLSILLKYFYCNQASPVTLPPPLAGGLNNLILVKTLCFIIFRIYSGVVFCQRYSVLPVLIVKQTNQDFLSLGQKIAISLIKAVS